MDFSITRDPHGVPHVLGETAADAWAGMGYACAQDRLFQLDYDRRRACGRWAEIAGAGAVGGDVLARRLGLAAAAQRDVAVMSATARTAFEAYASGVNAAIADGAPPLPGRYPVEPWQAWHSVAAFLVRHVLMGQWQHKLANAVLLARIGPSAFARLETRPPLGSPLAVPPGGRLSAPVSRLLDDALGDVVGHLGFLAEVEPGSNAWAVSGRRTAHGGAVICNDSHRALDTPNVYWQCRVSCPDFDVAGATFPGLPGFPHFGFNGSVGWAITHADADSQDLYLERFSGERYLTEDGWAPAELRQERIEVRGGSPVTVPAWATRHGPIVHGSPELGDRAGAQVDRDLPGQQRVRVHVPDADGGLGRGDVRRAGRLGRSGQQPGLRRRGRADCLSVPRRGAGAVIGGRAAAAGGRLGRCVRVDVAGAVRRAAALGRSLGRVRDDRQQRHRRRRRALSVVHVRAAVPGRAAAVAARRPGRLTVDALAGMQADTVSVAARGWGRVLGSLGPFEGSPDAEAARSLLAGFDGDLAAESAAALLYGCFVRALAAELYRPILGPDTWDWVASGVLAPTISLVRRWLGSDTWELLGMPTPPGDGLGRTDPGPGAAGERGRRVLAAVPAALASAWAAAVKLGGRDPRQWRWGDSHQAVLVHPLGAAEGGPGRLPGVPMGGDADTLQAAGYGWRAGAPFTVASLSVYRQVVDLADGRSASFVIPGGASGDPASPHFADQLAEWAAHRRIPMTAPEASGADG